MGVPSFYRWLVGKYPKIVVNAVQQQDQQHNLSQTTNPNGHFHNLYLDMNGIIHPCFHPEDQLFPPTTCDQVFETMFKYIDNLVNIVRPTNLLYMAIDGVAPRAKMNQQRARRYKNAKDAQIAEEEEESLRREYERQGRELLPKQQTEIGDSNVITPGTVLMDKLTQALESYIRLRLNTNSKWKGLKVILSDANVPGEGEHKILNFIRLQRGLPGYNPNTHHCLYGLDADLIMLALASHEVHFSIVREDVFQQRAEDVSFSALEASLSKAQHNNINSQEWDKKFSQRNRSGQPYVQPYQFVNMWTLREYFELEFTTPDSNIDVDTDKIVDDFVFICFFVGNDFLPHMPSFEMHEGALDLLLHVYKTEIRSKGWYLIDTTRLNEKKATYIKEKRLEQFFHAASQYEEKIFKNRKNIRESKIRSIIRERNESMRDSDELESCIASLSLSEQHKQTSSPQDGAESLMSNLDVQNTRDMLQTLKTNLKERGDLFKSGVFNDKVKLDCPGWQDRYYRLKFDMKNGLEVEENRKEVVKKYAEGLCWVLKYYYAGVCSWDWYFPFYYGPFASDLKKLSLSSISFKLGSPLKPLEQLMAVLPPGSASGLPEPFKDLVTNIESPIKVFYPTDFEIDYDGKRFTWQGVAKLPFIEEGLLLNETRKLDNALTDDEKRRNRVGCDRIFASESYSFGEKLRSHYENHKHMSSDVSTFNIRIDSSTSDGLNGFICFCENEMGKVCNLGCPKKEMEDIKDRVICAVYNNPEYHEHIPKLVDGVEVPSKTITEIDIDQHRPLWHEYKGSRPQHAIANSKWMSSSNDNKKAAGSGGCDESNFQGNSERSYYSYGSQQFGRGRRGCYERFDYVGGRGSRGRGRSGSSNRSNAGGRGGCRW